MKLSEISGLVLLVSLFYFSFTFLVLDFEENYIDTGISNVSKFNQSILGDFDYVDRLNDSIDPIKVGFDRIEENDGFFEKVLNFAVVIPIAIISVPAVIFTIVALAIDAIVQILNSLGIPTEVILMASVGIVLFIIFKLVTWWQRQEI